MLNLRAGRLPSLTVGATIIVALLLASCGARPAGVSPNNRVGQPTTSPVEAAGSAGPMTLIFHNGTVLTMDSSQPVAQAIAVADDTIAAVGTNHDILALQEPATQVIDLQGRTLMPGFVDSHTHIFNESGRDAATGTLEKAQALALKNGITTLANLYTASDFLAQMRAMDSAGRLWVRTSLYLTYSGPCGEVLGDWYKQIPPARERGEMLRIAGVKVFADGGSCGRPAVSFDRPGDGRGDLWYTQDQLNTVVADIDAAGYQVAIHAIGDRAVDEALNAIEFVLDGQPNTRRHRIEHNVTVGPGSYPRYQEIGVVATFFGNVWSCKDVFWTKGIVPDPPEFQAWNFPYRAILDASPEGHFAWHSDYPWASPNPLFHLYSMVTPNEIAGDLTECADPSWAGNKTLTLDEALPMMTMGSAYALFRDEEVGSLVPGKYADLIILSGDPHRDLNAVRDIEVWMTMVGGRTRWCAPDREALCPALPEISNAPESPAASSVRIRLQLQTTSDWATLTLNGGGTLVDLNVVSASAEATQVTADLNRIAINQPLDRANSGSSVKLIVDAYLADAQQGGQLDFVMESGAIGDTTVTFFNYPADSPVETATTRLSETIKAFSVPADEFLLP